MELPCKRTKEGSNNGEGYRRFRTNEQRGQLVHRWVYETKVGPLEPSDVIMHLCNNKWCVEPSHLHKGSQKENVKHAIETGQFHSKISKEIAEQIRDEYAYSGKTIKQIAKEFELSKNHVSRIINGHHW